MPEDTPPADPFDPPTDAGDADAGGATVGPRDVLEALLSTEPNPSIESLPGGEAVSYALRGTMKFLSSLLGKELGMGSITDSALHDYIRSVLAAREDSEGEGEGMDVGMGDL